MTFSRPHSQTETEPESSPRAIHHQAQGCFFPPESHRCFPTPDYSGFKSMKRIGISMFRILRWSPWVRDPSTTPPTKKLILLVKLESNFSTVLAVEAWTHSFLPRFKSKFWDGLESRCHMEKVIRNKNEKGE